MEITTSMKSLLAQASKTGAAEKFNIVVNNAGYCQYMG